MRPIFQKIQSRWLLILLVSLSFLPGCFDTPNYIDYQNFKDDHSIDYRYLFQEQLRLDEKQNREQDRQKSRQYLRDYRVD